ncbi:TraR/DksA family transcriptional regulator [Micromonospora chersina]|uniref:TraR/DksA family transcriptional regulator n=1 Tax=Micromonospora chersina TaxID=47854 RepID=UPI0036D08389
MGTDLHDDRLTRLRATLTEDFAAQTARLTELTADTGDPGEAHTRSALIAATRHSLGQIGDALRRMADGGYGRCQRCAGPIPVERLEALPHATFCVPCQQKHG